MKLSIIATAALALFSSSATGLKISKAKIIKAQKGARPLCVLNKIYVAGTNSILDVLAPGSYTVPKIFKNQPIECCIWKHGDGACEPGKDDKLVGCALSGKIIDLDKHNSAASFEIRCDLPGIVEKQRKAEREGLGLASCPARGASCSWNNSGKCEKHCGQRFFSKMEGCGWGKKRCCCHGEFDWQVEEKKEKGGIIEV
jgi:hypothetical protein